MINIKNFNMLGFVFSSFYLIYKRCSLGTILLFIFLPWLLTFAFLWTDCHVGLLFLLSFIFSHIIAGLYANELIRKSNERLLSANKNLSDVSEVEYFYISPIRLLIFSIITCGLYDIYWAYRQWSAYKKASSDNISPFGRAFFVDFTLYSLICKIQLSLKHDVKKTKILSVFYMLWNIILSVYTFNEDAEGISIGRDILITMLILFPSFFLYMIQKIICKGKEYVHDISKDEALWLILCVILSSVYLYISFEPYLWWLTV